MSKTFSPSFADIKFAEDTVKKLDALSLRRDAWETDLFTKSNDALYGLLADVLSIFQDHFLNATDSNKRTLRTELEARLRAASVRVQKNSTALGMLTRFVFKSDRKRAHGYATVLIAAISHNIEAKDLAEFIRGAGGIEEVKRKQTVLAETQQKREKLSQAAAIIRTDVEDAYIHPIAFIDLAIEGKYALLLARPNPDGTSSIVGVLPDVKEDDAVLSMLFKRMAKIKADTADVDAQCRQEADAFANANANTPTADIAVAQVPEAIAA